MRATVERYKDSHYKNEVFRISVPEIYFVEVKYPRLSLWWIITKAMIKAEKRRKGRQIEI